MRDIILIVVVWFVAVEAWPRLSWSWYCWREKRETDRLWRLVGPTIRIRKV